MDDIVLCGYCNENEFKKNDTNDTQYCGDCKEYICYDCILNNKCFDGGFFNCCLCVRFRINKKKIKEIKKQLKNLQYFEIDDIYKAIL